MITFAEYLAEGTEGKNLHLEHLEDEVLNNGVNGTRAAINFLQSLRDMLAGNTKSRILFLPVVVLFMVAIQRFPIPRRIL